MTTKRDGEGWWENSGLRKGCKNENYNNEKKSNTFELIVDWITEKNSPIHTLYKRCTVWITIVRPNNVSVTSLVTGSIPPKKITVL